MKRFILMVALSLGLVVALGESFTVVDQQQDAQWVWLQHGRQRQNRMRMNRRGLTIDDTSERRVEGTYATPDGSGVYFLSENDNVGVGKLLISTIGGVNLVYILQLHQRSMFISMAGQHLFIYRPRGEREVYRVPPSHLFLALNAVRENTEAQIDLVLTYLPRVSEEEGKADLSRILDLPEEIQMIVDAAKMMGSQGMSGERSPALRLLFAHALTLDRLLNSNDDAGAQNFAAHHGQVGRVAQSTCTAFPECTEERCPEGRECIGLCGLQCNCWEFLCGDCCTHQGCRDHDLCCERNIFLCLFPVTFSCNSFSC